MNCCQFVSWIWQGKISWCLFHMLYVASMFQTSISILKLIFLVQSKVAWCHHISEFVLELNYRPGQRRRPLPRRCIMGYQACCEKGIYLPYTKIFIHDFFALNWQCWFVRTSWCPLLSFNFKSSECKVVGMIWVQTWMANSETSFTNRNSCVVVFFDIPMADMILT